MTPEQQARQNIDALLQQAGWHVCDMANANIHASRGVALREFPLNTGYGFADYLLYIDGKAAGVIEAKKEGATLTGVEVQSARYAQGLPASLPAWRRPLPFSYESTGIKTHFTQGLDPEPRARAVFAFHRPETLAASPQSSPQLGGDSPHTVANSPHLMPELLSLAEPARLKPRLPAAEMQALVLRLCDARWLTSKDLAALLSRDAENLQGRILAELVKKGLLELRFLDVPNRPDQAYRTVLAV